MKQRQTLDFEGKSQFEIEQMLKAFWAKMPPLYQTRQLGRKQYAKLARVPAVHVTKKTRQGVNCKRVMAPGSERPVRVKGDTKNAESVYFKG